MAEFAGALATAVSIGMTAATTMRSQNIAKENAEREKELASMRASDRADALKHTLAAQRVALASQGRDPNVGTSLFLQAKAYDDAVKGSNLDEFQTSATIKNYQDEAVNSLLSGTGKAFGTFASYENAQNQASLKSGDPTKPLSQQ